jgi:predicted RNase H-like HicB family nuclease
MQHEGISPRLRVPARCYPARPMEAFLVHADWDPKAGVWVATSDDVPGLATEAATLKVLTQKLRILIPELLEANRLHSSDQQWTISVSDTTASSGRAGTAV